MRRKLARPTSLATVLTLTFLTAACGTSTTTEHASAPRSGHYPVSLTNCGVEVTFAAPPQRVALLESASVSILSALEVLDSVVVRAGAFPPEYYDDETNAALREIPSLGEDLDASGHLRISAETIIEQGPDLVLGLPDGVSREGLADVGITALVHPTLCPSGVETTTFDDVYDLVTTYGRIFDRRAAATELVASLRKRVSDVAKAVAGSPRRTAAVLYPTVGGGTVYAYGNESMAHPQLETAGFTNVYGDVDDRVFEVTLEDLVDRNPDVLVLLHSDGAPEAVKAAVTDLPGADALKAVRDDAVLVQLFNFTEPPTPLAVDGLERIHHRFGTGS